MTVTFINYVIDYLLSISSFFRGLKLFTRDETLALVLREKRVFSSRSAMYYKNQHIFLLVINQQTRLGESEGQLSKGMY